MTFTKKELPCYRMRHNGEWATVIIDGYHLPQQDRHGGELMIHSSYGTFAHHWSHAGEEFRKFLIGLSKDYLLGKLVPQKDLYEYDNVGSLQALRRHILEHRHQGYFSKKWARKVWDASCDLDSFLTSREFIDACEADEDLRKLNEPWDFCRTKQCARYDHFWNEIWVPFVAQLQAEVSGAS